MAQFFDWLPDSPIVSFTILLLVTLTVPPIFERFRLPGLVGLLASGVVLGPDGLGLLNTDSETMKLLSDIGKIYLMFVAGLEIDLENFRKTKERSLGFGVATFTIPLIFGVILGKTFNFDWNTSILIGSLLSSHTLLAFPIVSRLGVVENEGVTVTIGATIFTDIAALLVLAICVSIHGGEFSAVSLAVQLATLVIYSVIVLLGFDWAGKQYFRRTGDEQSNQFLFVLLAVFLASVGAQVINVDKIVGAFLAGLAVNDVVGRSPVEEKIEFLGSALFIPFFFVDMGLILNVSGFISSLSSELLLTLGIVGALIISKFLAALTAKFLYRYDWNETLTMWSLSLPQVAATLAAALVGKNVGLITDSVFNSVIVLMLVTSILGPVLTAKFAPRLNVPNSLIETNTGLNIWYTDTENLYLGLELEEVDNTSNDRFNIVVPVCNPHTEKYLIEVGALLARNQSGKVIPVSITKAHLNMDEPSLNTSLRRSKQLLLKASKIGQEFQAQVKPVIRIDDDIAQGICRVAREENASLIVMGWSKTDSFQARLFGNIIDSVFYSSHCPVTVMRLTKEPNNISRILVTVKNITSHSLRIIQFALLFANINQAEITLLHVCPRVTTEGQVALFEAELASYLQNNPSNTEPVIQIIRNDDVVGTVSNKAFSYDMVILSSIRRRTAGGLAVSDLTTEILKELDSSLILFGEPNPV
ncbi:MAG: cation:proton antiporter [Mastigocoleus sp. MO_167.B18]|uniref:cation:proton antiporter n=1 Tax=Mastigocoleus sp. MO_188.B34 TaxID=3036635 RepID=UPI00260D9506|nr:cation:proton antiporter [Mastigocoleus sp. MO_188.B34]MDJ0694472.1 cation:proton antiporter [Mastigocoleus sp. MO_188.B34]MDJ0773454.1 cation:proton antiporter [Mastigocoleus sp. MO_167.B18]